MLVKYSISKYSSCKYSSCKFDVKNSVMKLLVIIVIVN